MEETKFLKLLRALEQATKAGKVKWKAMPVDETFRARVGGGSVQIMSITLPADPESGAAHAVGGFQVWLYDDDNAVADSIETYEGRAHYPLLLGLHELARRSARNTDALVDRMLSELQRATSGSPFSGSPG